MSKISGVCGKSKIFKIEGIEIELKAGYINLDDLPALLLLAENLEEQPADEKERRGKIIADLVFKVLKKAIPDASDEEIKEFGLRNLKQIMEAIVEISGLKDASD